LWEKKAELSLRKGGRAQKKTSQVKPGGNTKITKKEEPEKKGSFGKRNSPKVSLQKWKYSEQGKG